MRYPKIVQTNPTLVTELNTPTQQNGIIKQMAKTGKVAAKHILSNAAAGAASEAGAGLVRNIESKINSK